MRLLLPLAPVVAAAHVWAFGQATPPTKPAATPDKPKAPASSPATRPAAAKPKPPTALEVVVQDPQGRPVSGALVSIAGGRELLPQPHSGRTDAEGRVRLESLPRPPWDVSVQAARLAPKRVERVDGTKPLVVRLLPGAALTGVVRDGTTREPVAGAGVWTWTGVGMVGADRWDPDAGRIATRADARGRFKLEGLGSGAITVAASAPGIGRAIRGNVRPGADVELFLMPGATISGVVRDDAGRPVKGAVVRAVSEGFGPNAPPERTDAGGRFAFGGLDGGRYVVLAREGPRAPAVASVSVDARGDAAVDLTLNEGGFVTGRLVDTESRPVPGRVRVASVDGVTLHVVVQDLVQAQAGADGRFVLGPTPNGELLLKFAARGWAERDLETSVARAREIDVGEVVLESGLVVRGTVQDRSGQGIAGASVRAFSGPSMPMPVETESDESGAFVLAGLAAGTVEVMVRAPGFAPARRTATVGADPIVIALDAGGTVVGTVVDSKDQAASGATIRAVPEQGEGPDNMASYGQATDGDGRFTLHDVRPGRYVVDARASSLGTGNVSGVRVAAGQTTDVGTVRLRSGGLVQGTVTDASSAPIAGASVRVETGSFAVGLSTQTDGTGGFQIGGLMPGRVDVVAQHPSYATARVTGITVDPERAAEADVVMTRGGRVEGSVRRRGGQPFAGGRVMVASRREPRGYDPRAAQPILEDGSFVVEHVAPGPSLLQVLAPSAAGAGAFASRLQTVIQRELDVVDGETSTVEIEARDVLVRGRVTRGGEPAPRLAIVFMGQMRGMSIFPDVTGGVGASPSSGPRPLAGVTQDDGTYELLVLEPGRYTAMRRTPDGNMSPLTSGTSGFVEIPDVATHTVDFTLGSAKLAGVVVEEESGSPVQRAFVSFSGKASRGSGVSDADGRFAFDTEPGDGKLFIRAEGFAVEERPLVIEEGGVEGLRIEISRGLEIAGRVVDPSGRPIGELQVMARSESSEGKQTAFAFGQALPDGTFRVRGLASGAYTVSAGSDRSGYGIQTGVPVGATDVRLTLRPPSTLRVRVVDPDGRPVAKAMARIEKIGGAPAMFPGRTMGTTDLAGMLELTAPEGLLTLLAEAEGRSGRTSVECNAGIPVSAEIVLSETRRPPAVPPR